MPLITQPTSITTGYARDLPVGWCIVEYEIFDPTGATPNISMYITACKLTAVFSFGDAATNSEWRKCVQPEHAILVKILSVGSKQECIKGLNAVVTARNPRPRCNMFGHTSMFTRSRILCSNGEIYENQSVAAQALGITQSHISRQLRGEMKTVKGFTFSYLD